MIDCFKNEYRFLSNFWVSDIKYNGKTYKTAEHAFQAAKCLYESDAENIWYAAGPADAKKLGRTVVMKPNWENIKIGIMLDILTIKFTENEQLKQKLLNTGTEQLIEGNWWGDTFWGVCNGVGENWLGELLMDIRKDLQNNHNIKTVKETI
jgi:N-glycosidase YbiA